MTVLCGFAAESLNRLREHMDENGLTLEQVMSRSAKSTPERIIDLQMERRDIDAKIAKLKESL